MCKSLNVIDNKNEDDNADIEHRGENHKEDDLL